MRMELIQPFINAADAVLSESLQSTSRIGDVSMEEEAYRRRGVAAMVKIEGDIEGRVIFDLDPPTAARIASLARYLSAEAFDDLRQILAREDGIIHDQVVDRLPVFFHQWSKLLHNLHLVS